MGDDRPIAYTEGPVSIYRASSIGSCLTALVAAKQGHKPARAEFQETVLMNAANEGNLHEPAIVERLKADLGWRVWGGQDVMEKRVIPNVFIRGHIDGFCIPKGARNDRLLEIKTMSKDRFKKWKASGTTVRSRLMTDDFIKYGWQISTYMHHYNIPAMYVVKNRDSGELDIGELKLPTVDWKTIKKKIIEAEMWAKRDELPPCVATSSEQFFCQYPYLHGGSPFGDEDDDEYEPFDSATDVLLSGMAAHYADLAAQVAVLKPLDDERKQVGKKILEALPSKKVTAGEWEISRVDSKRKIPNYEAAAQKLGMDPDVLTEAIEATMGENSFSYVSVKKAKTT